MSDIIQDLRFGLRSLARSPGFTAVALATIAIGIGANAAIFSYIDGILLKSLPFREPDRIVQVLEKAPNGSSNGISALNFLDWKSQNTVFEHLSAQAWGNIPLTGVDNPHLVASEMVSVHFFDVFETGAALGRTFAEGEDEIGREHVAVISHSFWISDLGGDKAVLGRKLILDGEPYEIIGVLPAGNMDRTATKVWRPLTFPAANRTRDFHWLGAWGLLKPGVSVEQARAQMTGLAIRMAHDYPSTNKGWGVAIEPIASVEVSPQLRTMLWVLMAAVGMVQLIACANLANLTLARGISRSREVAIRSALGAGRWRLARQFLTESLLLSFAGGALGLLLAYGGLAVLKATMPSGAVPPNMEVGMDGRILAFVVALSLVTGLLFGLVPALRASKGDLTESLKEGGHGSSAGASAKRLRSLLVVAEVSLAFVLLAGAGLLIRSFQKLQKVPVGFETQGLLAAWLPISAQHTKSVDLYKLYLASISDAVRAVPGVREMAFTSALPMEGWGYGMWFQIEGNKVVNRSDRPVCYFKMVGSSYFRTLGLHLLRGRLLDDHDVAGSQPVGVINETMAEKYFSGSDPIGRRVRIEEIRFNQTSLGPEIPWEVVGIVADEKLGGLSQTDDKSPGIYVSFEQSTPSFTGFVVRGANDSPLIQKSIVNAVKGVDRDQIVDSLQSMEDIKQGSVAWDRFRSGVLGLFSCVALMLAAVGLYGVISYSVLQQTREIGVRTALGASPGSILRLVLRGGLAMTAVGLVIGLAAAVGLSRFIASMLYNVGQYDPLTLAAVAGVLLLIAFAACLSPALRATRVSPTVALRHS